MEKHISLNNLKTLLEPIKHQLTPAADEEVLTALAENDLIIAVGDDEGVLCDENNNIIEW